MVRGRRGSRDAPGLLSCFDPLEAARTSIVRRDVLLEGAVLEPAEHIQPVSLRVEGREVAIDRDAEDGLGLPVHVDAQLAAHRTTHEGVRDVHEHRGLQEDGRGLARLQRDRLTTVLREVERELVLVARDLDAGQGPNALVADAGALTVLEAGDDLLPDDGEQARLINESEHNASKLPSTATCRFCLLILGSLGSTIYYIHIRNLSIKKDPL